MKTTCHKTPAPVIPETTFNKPWSPQLFEEITDLMAEALFQDFQAHRRATVQSPRGSDHTKILTDAEKRNSDRPTPTETVPALPTVEEDRP
jgi:hypothetical protein